MDQDVSDLLQDLAESEGGWPKLKETYYTDPSPLMMEAKRRGLITIYLEERGVGRVTVLALTNQGKRYVGITSVSPWYRLTNAMTLGLRNQSA